MCNINKMRTLPALIIYFLFFQIFSFGQNYERTINWLPNKAENLYDTKFELLNFTNAVYENISTGLPYYYEQFKMLPYNNDGKIEIVSANFEVIPSGQLKSVLNIDSIPTEIVFRSSVSYIKKKPFLQFSFIPLRHNKNAGTVEKLVSFTFKKSENNNQLKNIKSRVYASSSVLNSGKWQKIKINQTGIYKLTYKQISDLGFTNPDKIKIFGNGGKVLSVNNFNYRHDDLVENPIWFEKGTDGIFNSGDYILFYLHGPVYWSYNTDKGIFTHSIHPYSDESYYFITDDGASSKTLQTLPVETNSPNVTVNTFDDYNYHEVESSNFIKSGKLWVGEYFNNVLTSNFDFSFPMIDQAEQATFSAMVYGRASVSNSFSFSVNSTSLGTASIGAVQLGNVQANYSNNNWFIKSFNPTSSNLSFNVTYNKPAEGGEGWLDYIEVNVRKQLAMQGGQIQFRDIKSVGASNVSEFQITNATNNTIVLDVTNPVNPYIVPTVLNGNLLTFTAKSDTLHEYIAFDGTITYSYTNIVEVANQNLHGLVTPDLVIVSHPDFLTYANTLAEFHRTNDNLSVLVVTPEIIYNEFSSGSPDVTAIKDLMKMFYDRAGADTSLMPKYLLFYGDGSYDNRHNFSYNTNFILTYQSTSSLSSTASFCTDDYFGMLDDNEYDYVGALDIGVGRLPVKNSAEAQGVLNKIINYYNPTTNGDWKNWLTFIGDDEDSNEHMSQSNQLCTYIDTTYHVYNIDKIFLDAFQQITTPNGDRYPDVNTAISNRMKKGTLLMNYTGHGNEIGLTHEHIIGVADINSWTNFEKLPLFITATCEFSRYDDFARTSAGEMVILNQNGGAVAMFTTTRLVYSSSNFAINSSFINRIFKKDSNRNYFKLGDIYMLAKNATSSNADINKRNFSLLGDPAVKLAYPKYLVLTDSINGVSTSVFIDTLHALQKYTIKGHIVNQDSTPVVNYNGTLYPTIFDKPITIATLANDGGSTFYFKLQNNVLYKGKATITNSIFEFTFVVPKDIQYNIGYGKVSYYAENGTVFDAHGFTNVFIGGNSTDVITDVNGPEVQLYINDENFVYGGITDENPYIYAKLHDENGINTVGNGIGHDITAVLDGNTAKTIVLNDYYEGDLNNYQSGTVRYPLSGISDGLHNIKFKAWDVFNNSVEAYTEFVVSEALDLTIGNIFNYPNPFTTHTDFYFDHNQINSSLDVLIQVFTVSGKLIKSIKTTLNNNSFHSTPITWDGLDDYGDKIGKGVYIYKLTVKAPNEQQQNKFEKLVILR